MSRTQYVRISCARCGERPKSIPQGVALSVEGPLHICSRCDESIDGPIHPEHELNSEDADVVPAGGRR